MDTLVAILQSTTVNNGVERRAGEERLQQASRSPGFGALLTALVVDESPVPYPLRQLAGLVLCRHVKSNWATLPGDPDASLVVISDAEKAQIKMAIPRGLTVSQSKLRTVASMTICAIAATDFPSKWPTLLNDLVHCLGSGNQHLVQGAMKTLDMLASSSMADDQVPIFLQTVFPALHSLFNNPNVDDNLKARAASIVASVVRWMGVIAGNDPKAVKGVIHHSLQLWMDGFLAVLKKPDSPNQSALLKLRVMSILIAYSQFFNKLFQPYAAATAQAVWANLIQDVPLYEKHVLYSDDMETTGHDSDGNVLGFEPLVSSYIEFVHSLTTKKTNRDILKSNYQSIIGALLHYLQLTVAQREQFADDPNEYLQNEDEDLARYSIRVSCIELLQSFSSSFGREFLQALLGNVTAALQGSLQKFQGKDSNWWLLREASVYALGSVLSDIRKLENVQSIFNVAAFFDGVILADVSNRSVAELRGRALWFVGQAVGLSMPEINQRCVPVAKCAVQMLSNQREALPVKVAACQCVSDIAATFVAAKLGNDIVPAIGPAIRGCCELFGVCSKETIPVVLEILLQLLESHCQGEYVAFVMQNLIGVWKKYSNDPFAMGLVVEIVEVICKSPECVAPVTQTLLPVIVSVYTSQPPAQAHVLDSATSLLAICSRCTPNAISAPGFANLFHHLVTMAESTVDASLLQSTTLALIGYVQSAALSEQHLGQMLGVVRRLLSNAVQDEDASMHVGKLILKMILHAGNTLASVTPQLLGAVLNRLATAKTPALQQTLILVFARLIHVNVQKTLSFLSTATLPDGSIALPMVMRLWLETQPTFAGVYERKVTLLALVQLLQLNNPQLNSITVRGAPLPTQGRQTRSKGPIKYQETSLQQKILSLLVSSFVELATEDCDVSEEGDDAYSSDEDDGNEDGFDGDTAFYRELSDIIRGAADGEEDLDPVFADDPLSQVDLLPILRGVLVSLWNSNQKFFEVMIGQCDADDRLCFVKIWQKQLQAHQQQKK